MPNSPEALRRAALVQARLSREHRGITAPGLDPILLISILATSRLDRRPLAEFVRCGVRFVLLGGYAVGVHVKPRATKNLDLLVSGEGDNLSRVAAALTAFGALVAVIEAARLAPARQLALRA